MRSSVPGWPPSIARRLALMFAAAAALVFSVTGYALYEFQCMEMRRHQLQEIGTRFEFVDSLVAKKLSSVEKWPLLQEKLEGMTPENGRVFYLIESGDPRFRYGAPPAGARITNEGSGLRRIVMEDRKYLSLTRTVPAFDERPDVQLTVAVDANAYDATTRAISIALAIAIMFVVVAVAGLGWWIARRSLAPVDDLSRHAEKLHPQNLGERLPVTALPSELDGLAHAFNGALARVEQAYLQLSMFNADVAHELRTPLGNLIGQTQVILSRERTAEELSEVLHSNLEELERLRSIINDMLFLAQADRGTRADNLEYVALAGEVKRCVEFLDMLLEDAGATLTIEGEASACIERSLFGRAITNLLQNAIQHGDCSAPIQIVIGKRGDQVAVAVVNRGPRIAPQHLERLFDRFYRLDSARSDSQNSHGLGLAIVKAIALMHGGSVFAESSATATTIGFTLSADYPVDCAGAPPACA